MKEKIEKIINELKITITPYCNEKFWINWYGAYNINPKYLVVIVCVINDKLKLNLKSNYELLTKIKEIFYKNNYPEEAINKIHIEFESQETVNRESNGNWYIHFK